MIQTIYCKDDSLMDRFLIDIHVHGFKVDWDWYNNNSEDFNTPGLKFHWLNMVDGAGISIHNHSCYPSTTRELTSRNYLTTLKMVLYDK